jgi:Na+-driven multidrug efflux pump
VQEAAESTALTSRGNGFVATVREALAGSQRDLTEGNLKRAIILLAIPMILEMLMESLFGVVDMF